MRLPLILLLLLGNTCSLFGQNGFTFLGAAEAGTGNALSPVKANNVMFHNVAGISLLKQTTLLTGYDYRGFVEGINSSYIQLAIPRQGLSYGIGLMRYGDEILNETHGSFGLAHRIGISSIGFKINYHQYFSEPFGFSRSVSFSGGVVTSLSKEFDIGVAVSNLGLISLEEENQYFYIPQVISIGASYMVTENLVLATSAIKDLEYELLVTSGIVYKPINALALRTGVNWSQQHLYYGFGFRVKRLAFDYAFQSIRRLGATHSITLSLFLKQNIDEVE